MERHERTDAQKKAIDSLVAAGMLPGWADHMVECINPERPGDMSRFEEDFVELLEIPPKDELTQTIRQWAIETLLKNGQDRHDTRTLAILADVLVDFVLNGAAKQEEPPKGLTIQEEMERLRKKHPDYFKVEQPARPAPVDPKVGIR